MTDAARLLLQHALDTEWDELSPATRSATRTFLHDSLAVGVAGRNAPLADEAFAAACGWAGTAGTSLVLGRPGTRLPAPYAAFVNAYQIHAQEFDCVHEPAVAHPMATVASALLAEAGRSGPYAGADFLAALVAGVDVVATLGVAVKGKLKFFRPATAGIFGSVAALARLRGCDIDAACNAYGYALSFASGTMQAHLEGKPALAVQVAAAARSAIEAMDLALAGFAGPAGSIDGPFGYFALFEDDVALDAALAELGTVRRIEEVSWKPFPTGRAAHGAIVALRQLVAEQGLDADRLERFVYRAPPLIARLVGRRPFPEMGVAYARLCLAWLGAVTIQRGEVGLADFTAESLADPALHALAARIHVEADDNPDMAAFVPATGIATLQDGTELRVDVMRQFGSPEWPLSRREHLAKAEACLNFGGLFGVGTALAEAVDNLDQAPDAALFLADALEDGRQDA